MNPVESHYVPLDITVLADDARVYIERLFARYPGWRKYAVMVSSEDGKGWDPYVKIPSPTGDSARDLVFTHDDESGPVLVFGSWHGHVENFTAISDEASYEELWRRIEAILADELVLVAKPDDHYWSLVEYTGTSPEPYRNREKSRLQQFRVLSWTGRRDLSF